MSDNEEDRFYSLLYLEDTKYDGEGNNKIPPLLNYLELILNVLLVKVQQLD